ncbi:MAG: hypothetical protein FWG36_02045 [Oscillospiraceae bacterium]|nr:hypothetical protein [Oscillospiraceae bacterium]
MSINVKIATSKLLLFFVMLSYFFGLGLGTYLVLEIFRNHPDWAVQAFIAMLSYIGVPVGTTIVFYSRKAEHENVAKIECSRGEE